MWHYSHLAPFSRTGKMPVPQRVISFPVASELILPEIRTRQCRFPTINPGRETALPCPLYHSGAAGIDMNFIVEQAESLFIKSLLRMVQHLRLLTLTLSFPSHRKR